ncbi:hypothetical protein PYW08_012217 [Mythimna loreyi]|uniref:Uncharacterized protein n=1 Tax=Mythimna loreyi TaxID=667449 RepID=A0ACC2Q1E8_9NEOP|nr:hypothetical protein PYW08_012217 [Mythimna loreyi]
MDNNGNLDFVSNVTSTEGGKDVKLRSKPYVLINREKVKEDSKDSKVKRKKRKHRKCSEDLEESDATTTKTDAMKNDVNRSKNKRRKRRHGKSNDDLEEIEATNTKADTTNVGTNADANEDGDSNHSKIKTRKRKHIKPNDDLEEIEATNTKADTTNVGTNAAAKEDDDSNNSKMKHRKRKHTKSNDDLEESEDSNTKTDATNVGTNAGAKEYGDSNNSKKKHRKKKHSKLNEENDATNIKTDATNVDTNASANEDVESNHSKKHRKRKHSKHNEVLEEKDAINTKTDATNVGPNSGASENSDSNSKEKHRKNSASEGVEGSAAKSTETDAANAGASENNTKEPTSDLPEVKFTIVHLTEDEMLKTREIDRNDRLYLNRAFKCQTCITGFLEMAQHEKHNNEKHSVRMGTLVCPICETRFKKEAFLELHQKSHYRSYRCRHCNFEHHRRYVIETHVVKEHDLKPSPVCPDCDMEFDTQKLLVSHYEVAHKERLKCNICGESFDTYARVTRHAAIHKGAIDNGVIVEIFHCARCNCNFEGKATYRTHMQFSHRDLAQNAYCADCDVQFSAVHKYTQHLEESDEHSRLGERKFDCLHCTFKFLTKDALLAHIVRSHRLLSQTCAMCNKGFSDPPRLKNHIQAKHPEVIAVKPVMDKICPICSHGFITRIALLDHMRTHKAEKPFACKKCDKRFAFKTLLKKHNQRMHQDEDN